MFLGHLNNALNFCRLSTLTASIERITTNSLELILKQTA